MPDGPYKSERDASAAARAVIPPEPGWSILSQSQHAELLHRALAEAGVETSEYEDGTAWWLSGWEDSTVAVIARWVTRAREAGKVARPDGDAAEWGVRFTVGGPTEHPCTSEEEARAVVASMRDKRPENNAVLVKRVPGRPAGPWEEVPDA